MAGEREITAVRVAQCQCPNCVAATLTCVAGQAIICCEQCEFLLKHMLVSIVVVDKGLPEELTIPSDDQFSLPAFRLLC